MNTSGDRLRTLLREVHLSASDFAKNRDVTPQHVNNWFKRGVPMARLDEIAELLSVTSRWLRTGEGPKYPPTNLQLEGPNHANSATAREDCGHYRCGPSSGPEKIDVEIPSTPPSTPRKAYASPCAPLNNSTSPPTAPWGPTWSATA